MEMTRRQFVASPAALTARKGPPNVLVFMSDQESALLPGPVALPNRRRLAKAAIQFTNAFCNTPQCSPARAALLTGLEPHHAGVLTNVDRGSLGKPLPSSLPTVGSVFRAAGYRTAYFGKWHLGDNSGGAPTHGFSTYEGGDDEEVARQGASWIGNASKQTKPWLAWVSILNPHHIYEIARVLRQVAPRPGVKAPSTNLSNLSQKPFEQREFVDKDQGRLTRAFSSEDWVRYRSYYCSLVEKADTAFGNVLDAIPDLESTVVVYTSDHGDALGEHGLPFKGPFMYEELLRVPLWIAGGGLRRGKRDVLATQADLAPTLVQLAGIRWPGKLDGIDLLASVPRDAVFLEYYAKQKWVNPIRTIRTRRWKLNSYSSGSQELYDLAADPGEARNRAGDVAVAKVQVGLQSRLNAWREPLH